MIQRMTIKKAYKFKFYPAKKQKELLAKSFGCCRIVYNQALNFKIKQKKVSPTLRHQHS